MTTDYTLEYFKDEFKDLHGTLYFNGYENNVAMLIDVDVGINKTSFAPSDIYELVFSFLFDDKIIVVIKSVGSLYDVTKMMTTFGFKEVK